MHFLHHHSFFSLTHGFMRYLTQLNYIHIVAKTGSIRKAAEQMNITSTALNRRILALEDELGYPIFERLPQGVRLNVAGELLIQHIRSTMADLSKVMSQISDLSGVRRGHVSIAGGSEVIGALLPARIAHYRRDHSNVTFEILRRAPQAALRSLDDFSADISLVLGPVVPSEYQILATVSLQLMMRMSRNHPLAGKDSLRLADCQDYPAIIPSESAGLYDLLYAAQTKKGVKLRQIITSESYEFMTYYCQYEDAISFALPLSQDDTDAISDDIIVKPFDTRDQLTGLLHIVQAKGRVLPVASAKFAEELVRYLNAHFPDDLH